MLRALPRKSERHRKFARRLPRHRRTVKQHAAVFALPPPCGQGPSHVSQVQIGTLLEMRMQARRRLVERSYRPRGQQQRPRPTPGLIGSHPLTRTRDASLHSRNRAYSRGIPQLRLIQRTHPPRPIRDFPSYPRTRAEIRAMLHFCRKPGRRLIERSRPIPAMLQRGYRPRPTRRGPVTLRSLLQDHVGIRAAHPESAHPGTSRKTQRPPCRQPLVHIKRRPREIDPRIRLAEMQHRRQHAMPHRKRRLDQPGHPRRRVQMPYVGLRRPHRAVLRGFGPAPPERLRQSRNLNRIPQRRPRPMRFYIGDRFRIHPSHLLRPPDRPRLPLHARGGEAHLRRAIVIQAVALDHRVDGIARRPRVLQPLQNHHPAARPEHRSLRIRVERPAVPVRRHDPAFLVHIGALLRERDRHPARQRHIAFPASQAGTGLRHRHQRRGTRRAQGDAGSGQVQLVGHPRRQEIRAAPQHGLVVPHLVRPRIFVDELARPAQIVQEIRVRTAPREHSDRARIPRRIVPRIVQRRNRTLQEHAVLRVHGLGFLGQNAEVGRIEQFRIF